MHEKQHSSGPAGDASEQVERDAHSVPDDQEAVAAMVEPCACCPEVMAMMMDKHRARRTAGSHPAKP
jgi:hypothetical protein